MTLLLCVEYIHGQKILDAESLAGEGITKKK